jgi:hypothetical protein
MVGIWKKRLLPVLSVLYRVLSTPLRSAYFSLKHPGIRSKEWVSNKRSTACWIGSLSANIRSPFGMFCRLTHLRCRKLPLICRNSLLYKDGFHDRFLSTCRHDQWTTIARYIYHRRNDGFDGFVVVHGTDTKLRADFARSILMVSQSPGLEPGFFEHLLRDGAPSRHGAIIQTLGTGNVTSEPSYSIIPSIARAYELGVPAIVTSQYPPNPGVHTKYSPAEAPIQAGASHTGNMTAVAVTKFRWVLANALLRRGWRRMTQGQQRELVSELLVGESVIVEL